MSEWIYKFVSGNVQEISNDKNILGNKGVGLTHMCNLGLPIPPGFTISTELCKYYYQHEKKDLPLPFISECHKAINSLESITGKTFGRGANPLLLSVRSGASVSMPGMMDTILNLGMNDQVFESLANITNNRHFALDSYRRFLEMFGTTVLGIDRDFFEDIFTAHTIPTLTGSSIISDKILEQVVRDFKEIINKYSSLDFLHDPYLQLNLAIKAVLNSWTSDRAMTYRALNNLDESLGTAVTVQSMVFGNLGNNSATGVVFSRSPITGDKQLFGEFLINAQGEDIVSGTRTPSPIIATTPDAMQNIMPDSFRELTEICHFLEKHYKDMQDIEFTIENGKLYILQTRVGKRTAAASIKIAVNMCEEGTISQREALLRVAPESITQLLHAKIDYNRDLDQIAQGLPASPGAASGIVVFSPYDAEELSHHHRVILVRNDTSPEDIKGMHFASAILTARGGMTSHAAVVARGMGRPCVCGASSMIIDEYAQYFKVGDTVVKQGDYITIDGDSGKVFLGKVGLKEPHFSEEFKTILEWAKEHKKLGVRTNAETLLDVSTALKFGAEGIGLCRTEHMFFDSEKIPLIRQMIIATNSISQKKAIDQLLIMQVKDFKDIFRVLHGKPVNIRLLDPPLHEFLPHKEEEKQALASMLSISMVELNHKLRSLHEVNPMLGHRGCRLGISTPEIYDMQVQAIFTAIKEIYEQENIITNLELMIPLVSDVNEIKFLQKNIAQYKKILPEKLSVKVGTMIELPRAALKAGEIAREVEYFSFGTNDLTQTTYGISRDDIASFLPKYLEQKIYAQDPFTYIDQEGVGELLKIAIERGLRANPSLKLGVCGEHGGEPRSISFFQRIGVDYVSCSPYRIPIAVMAAAHANIVHDEKDKS